MEDPNLQNFQFLRERPNMATGGENDVFQMYALYGGKNMLAFCEVQASKTTLSPN